MRIDMVRLLADGLAVLLTIALPDGENSNNDNMKGSFRPHIIYFIFFFAVSRSYTLSIKLARELTPNLRE